MSQLTRIRPGHPTQRFSPALCLLLLAIFSSAAVAQSSDRGTWRIYYEPSHERVQLTFEHYENGARHASRVLRALIDHVRVWRRSTRKGTRIR
jgi:hypothetical protein